MRRYSDEERDALRDTILETARTQLSTKGWEGISVRELAKALGKSPGPVQDNFSQAELADELVRLTYDVLFDVTANLPAPYRVDDVVRTSILMMRKRPQTAAFAIHVISALASDEMSRLPGLSATVRGERVAAAEIMKAYLSEGLDHTMEAPVADVAPALLRWFELACWTLVTNPEVDDADLHLLRRAIPTLT